MAKFDCGIDVIFDKSDIVGDDLQAKVGEAIAKAAFTVEALAKAAIMNGPKTGRLYGKHRASAPGEAPANDLGDLVNSISADVTAAASDLEAEVVATSDHAVFVEFGTIHIEPRPFMTPAAEQASAQLDADIARIKLDG